MSGKKWEDTNIYKAFRGITVGGLDAIKDQRRIQESVKDYLARQGFILNFDTGGYTGSWGDSGRLAFLHQKELVLNAQDTANMLQMTNMVRELSEYIDFQAAATNLGRVSTTIGSVSALAGGELNQNVHIEATFPNVSEAYEIEEALTNLVNRAAQYANRK